jgi:hypothetical protein
VFLTFVAVKEMRKTSICGAETGNRSDMYEEVRFLGSINFHKVAAAAAAARHGDKKK